MEVCGSRAARNGRCSSGWQFFFLFLSCVDLNCMGFFALVS